jgi:hypothetical protein
MPSRRLSATDVGNRLGRVTSPSGNESAEVWFAWVGDHTHDVDQFSRDYLSTDERARLGEYRSRDAAERYVVTRSLVRSVLGEQLNIRPRDIRVSRTDTGKPVVAEGVHFNLSHSGERAVGVDVERRRDVARVHALTRRWLTDPERRQFDHLRALGESDSDAFLRIWSLKEAQEGLRGSRRFRLSAHGVRSGRHGQRDRRRHEPERDARDHIDRIMKAAVHGAEREPCAQHGHDHSLRAEVSSCQNGLRHGDRDV